MPSPKILTAHREEQLRREKRIYERYTYLRSLPGAMPTACEKIVMDQFSIKHRSTIFAICRRYQHRTGGQVDIQALNHLIHCAPSDPRSGTHSLDAASHTAPIS